MKYLRLFGILVITILLVVPVFAKKNIHIGGKWDKTQRSLEIELPIHAWVEDSNEHVSLFFEDDLGDVHVTVSDSFGKILYNQVIHTNESSSVTIPVKDVEGECTLSVTDGKNHVFGEFSIN
ncbi:DUF3244 domain-containing protein [Parabacteroides sp. AM58-2XD]|uniref:DUF3244 domain-containing protein n=1 Tax=Parabacteroides TaxID=375288 RepID=UPI000FE1880E|nr:MULTISPECIES: DUF3244 domain-containing protein [Parabacteroides]RGY90589.1 DUF3244 domain-containing protein [Parabacteroides sp. AM58-2XD]GKG72346.1 hypothetical protein CE91St1_14890 [Parabacteroides goldsteinii]GKG78556.1 hypothetical protein CE91St2_17480 [Parabacteroides goldsteinii]